MAATSTTGAGSFASPGRGRRLLALAFLGLFVLLILLGLGIVLFGNPDAGEPVVRFILPALKRTATVPRPVHPAATATPDTAPAAITQAIHAGTALVADPALVENTPDGPLPKIGADGTPPLRAYAAPVADTGKPRIAIVVTGLGVSAKATAAALATLPPQVTLAFAPYAADVQHWVSEARSQGHEVLLEVPMEPFDFPDSDPGPQTLRAGASENANTARLAWSLTRFTGYTGVTNLLGGRLMSDADSLAPVMTYLARRGLLFYDNGGEPHSAAPDVAAHAGVAFAQASSTIDAIQAAAEIDRQLSDLEAKARATGSASGSGFLYPVTLQRVSAWAQGLSSRGFVLVPASAIVAAKK